jgi:hypothetical protein
MATFRGGFARCALLLTWMVVVLALAGTTSALCHDPAPATAHTVGGDGGHAHQDHDGAAPGCGLQARHAIAPEGPATGITDGVGGSLGPATKHPTSGTNRALSRPPVSDGGRTLLIACGVART